MATDIKVDERIIEAQFWADLARCGITLRQSFTPIMDGKLHRFSTAQDKWGETSGAYLIHADSWPSWFIQDYRQNIKANGKFNAGDLSTGERAEIFKTVNDPEEQQRRAAEKAKEEERQREKQQAAMITAHEEYKKYTDQRFTEHSYAVLKHLTHGNKMLNCLARIRSNGDLLIPLYSADSVIKSPHNSFKWQFQSLQTISAKINEKTGKHDKRFFPDAPTKGACLPLIYEQNLEKIGIAEGAATAASLYYFFNYEIPIFAAMNCGNLINVAKAIRGNAPNSEITIYADNDRGKNKNQPEKNIGYEEALKVLEAGYADKVKQPELSGMDYNDLLITKGLI